MSHVTDVAIIAHDAELAAITAISAHLDRDPGEFRPLGPPFPLDSGDKAGSFAAWGGAFNYLDWDDFANAVKSAPWKFPDWVTVIRHGESDDVPLRLGIGDLP